MFFAFQKPKTTVFTMLFCFWKRNSRYLHFFLSRAQQKHWYLRGFQLVARYISICKNNKRTVFYDVFASCAHLKKRQNIVPKRCKIGFYRLPESFYKFSIVFPGPVPQKTLKHQQNKGFRGGSPAQARPRVAKARCRLPSHTASIAGLKV